MATIDEIHTYIMEKVFQEFLYKEEDGQVINENNFVETFGEILHSELDYFMETELLGDLIPMFDLMPIIKLFRDTYGGLDDLFKLPDFIIYKRLIYFAIYDYISNKENLFELYNEFKQKERVEGERAEGERAEGEEITN